MDIKTLPIIILAAGQSSRMRGRDKLMEDIDGAPLLRHQAEKALRVSRNVIVALPSAPHPRYEALNGLAVNFVPVPDASEGMNASLRRAFAQLPSDAPAAMLLLADLPDLTAEDLRRVAQEVDLSSDTLIWRGTTSDGAQGHPIVFHASLFPAFAELSGDSGGREIVALAKDRIKYVALEGQRARNDLDTPEEWARWRKMKNSA